MGYQESIIRFKGDYKVQERIDNLDKGKERRKEIMERILFLNNQKKEVLLPYITAEESLIQMQVAEEFPKGKGNKDDRDKRFAEIRATRQDLKNYDAEVATIEKEIAKLNAELDQIDYDSKVNRSILGFCTEELKVHAEGMRTANIQAQLNARK